MREKVEKGKSIRIHSRGDKEGNHKTHQTFVRRNIKLLIKKNKKHFSWLRNKKIEDYPAVTRYLLQLKCTLKSKRILKLAFIHNFGYKKGKLNLKELGKRNAAFDLFQDLVKDLSVNEVNRQRAQNGQLLNKIDRNSIHCKKKEEKNQGVHVKTYSPQQKKKKALQQTKDKDLRKFVQELIEGKNKKESQEDSDLESQESQTPQIPKRVTRSNAKTLTNVSVLDGERSFQMQSDIRGTQVQQLVPVQKQTLKPASLTQPKRQSIVSNYKQQFHEQSKLSQKDQNCLKPDSFDEEKSGLNLKLLQDEKIQTLFNTNRKRRNSVDSIFNTDYFMMKQC